MIKKLKNIGIKALNCLNVKFHTLMFAIAMALYITEIEILKADTLDVGEGGKITQRMRSRNSLLEKFYNRETDQKYVEDYYKVLKAADKFMRQSTREHMAAAADRCRLNYDLVDDQGDKQDHFGFFDDKHKNAGKVLDDVIKEEYLERRTTDDDFTLLSIFSNKPIEVGFSKIFDTLEKNDNILTKDEEDDAIKLAISENFQMSKQFKFPISCGRENHNIVNKIEQLTEFIHVKDIGFENRQFEFFIPSKFKTWELDENSDIFKELINFQQIWIKEKYGDSIGFTVNEYVKRLNLDDKYDVLKFHGIEMERI